MSEARREEIGAVAIARRLDIKVRFNYQEAGDVTDEIARKVPGYRRFRAYGFFGWGKERAVDDAPPEHAALQPVAPMSEASHRDGEVALLTGRTLDTSLEGGALAPQAAA